MTSEEQRQYQRDWHASHPGYLREWRREHTDRVKVHLKSRSQHSSAKRWRQAHPDYSRNYWREQAVISGSTLVLAKNLRNRVSMALKRTTKTGSTLELLGCSISKLKLHLEAQFKPGMSWRNYGSKGWHIDHKIPCTRFDLAQPAQQRACFHYSNLQPLWWLENLIKSGN